MSREFGNTTDIYFHDKIKYAAEDCADDINHSITKMWGKFLEIFYEVAYDVSTYEAGDALIQHTIQDQLDSIEKMRKQLDKIETGLRWVRTKANK